MKREAEQEEKINQKEANINSDNSSVICRTFSQEEVRNCFTSAVFINVVKKETKTNQFPCENCSPPGP